MKKILSIMMLTMLVVLMGCSSSSSYDTASAEDQATAEAISTEVFSTALTALSTAFSPGISSSKATSIPTTYIDGDSGNIAVSGSYSDSSATLIMVYNSYTSGTTTISGTITFTLSGSETSFEGVLSGDLNVTYAGTTYDNMEFNIIVSHTSTSTSVTGYIIINNTKATMNYSS